MATATVETRESTPSFKKGWDDGLPDDMADARIFQAITLPIDQIEDARANVLFGTEESIGLRLCVATVDGAGIEVDAFTDGIGSHGKYLYGKVKDRS